MRKIVVTGLVAFLFAPPQLAHAQAPPVAGPVQLLSDADLKALTDRRIEVLKFALRLTPEQEKYWPQWRGRFAPGVTARHQWLADLAARASKQRERNPIEFLRERADVLAQRAAGLQSAL